MVRQVCWWDRGSRECRRKPDALGVSESASAEFSLFYTKRSSLDVSIQTIRSRERLPLCNPIRYLRNVNLSRFISLSAIVVIFTFPLGCRHSAVAYVLHRNGPDAVISPPLRSTDTEEAIVVAIKNARRDNTKSDCDIAGDVISLRWQGRSADVTFYP